MATTLILGVMLTLVGCNNSPGTDELAAFLREQHRELDSSLILEGVEIVDSREVGSPPVMNVAFVVNEKSKVDMFDPIPLEEAYKELQHDPTQFKDAIERWNGLREPERSEAGNKKPAQQYFSQVHRKAVSTGDEFQWTGTVTAERKDDRWIFSGMVGDLSETGITPDTVQRDKLPENAIILDGAATNELTGFIDQQKQFVQEVNDAEKRVEARLKKEHAFLLSTLKQTTPGWLTCRFRTDQSRS